MLRCAIEPLESRFLLATIFNIGPTALPGDVLSLQGDGFGANPQLFLTSPTTSTMSVPILTRGDGGISARIPTNVPLNVYSLYVFDGSSNSNMVHVNRATAQHYDSPEVAANGSFRIFGRNLLLPGATPTVRLVNPATSASFNATVDVGASDAYTLAVKAPANLPAGVTYDVYVSNGYGGANGETKAEQPIVGRAAGLDPWSLNVPWAADFRFSGNVYNVKTDPRLAQHAVGDGVNNDRPAINAAITAAANFVDPNTGVRGGVVYLPAGTYRMSSNSTALALQSNVVVVGDGMNATTVLYGFAGSPASGAYGATFTNNVSRAGISGLTLTNVNSSGNWKNTIAATGGGHQMLFLNGVRSNMDGGDWMYFRGDKLLVQNCEFNQQTTHTPLYNGVITIGNSTNTIIRGTHITLTVGSAIDSLDGRNLIFENNTITRDLSYQPTASTRHGIALTWDTNVAVLNNTFNTTGGSNYLYNNDGESVISEGGGPNRRDEKYGTVTGATSNTLTDSSRTFSFSGPEPIVTIVSGKGMGQWRRVIGVSGGTLTLDRPWDVQPTAGSHYSTFNWSAAQWVLKGNTLTNQGRGFWFYNGSTRDVAIVDNLFTNSDGVYLRPNQTLHQNNAGFNVIYNTQLIGNTLVNTSGARPAYLANLGIQVQQAVTFGTPSIGVEMRNNSITAHVPNSHDQDQTELGTEGYINYLRQQGPPTFVDTGVPFLLGTIFQNNTAINTNNAYSLSSGSYNTVIWDATNINVGQAVRDDQMPGSNHKSVRTIIGNSPVNAAPTVATAAKADPNPVTGNSVSLSVLGADDNGESNLSYTWTVTGNPPSAVTFAENSTNAAKNTVAHFTAAGVYWFLVTIQDLGGKTVTSSVNVTVNAVTGGQGRMIGLEFAAQEVPPGGSGLASSHVAGVVPQSNWNNLRNGSGSEPGGGSLASLIDNTGAATGVGVSWSSQGTWRVNSALENPAGGDEEMAMSAIFDHLSGNEQGVVPITITNVPYDLYDVYVYTVADNDRDFVDVIVNNQTLYGVAQDDRPNLDGDPSTPFPWVQITGTNPSTTAADGRNGGNYAKFTGLSASTLNIMVRGGANPPVFAGPYNTTISGIQIVERSASGLGSISGNVFNDKGSNGINDGADTPVSGWTLYLDTNNNNVKDAGETGTTTDASGNYTFSGLSAGTYHVKQVLQTGYRKTNPGSGIPGYDVVVSGAAATGKDFGVTTNIFLGGTVFNDANNNGVQDGNEAGLSNVTINIVSNNTTIATRTTDAQGKWQVKGLSAGTGSAVAVVPAGYTATNPGNARYDGSASSGQQIGNLNFGLRQTAPAPAAVFSGNSILESGGDSLIDDILA